MELNSFARIGKGVIHKAIGLQKNHKEHIIKGPDQLNEVESNCFDCPIYKSKKELLSFECPEAYELQEQCQNCSSAIWENNYSIVYINEANTFGYQPTLKAYAIKLLLLYHFLQPDTMGLIKNIGLKDLAAMLGCSVASILSSNKMLENYGYCYFSDSGISDHHINIWLTEYREYHKTAKEGGRGYITLSSSLMTELLKIKPLNTLRLDLRGILEVDNASIHNIKETDSTTTSYDKLRWSLPDYCKRNVIIKSLDMQPNTIFDLTFQDKTVTFKIKEPYVQKKIREDMEEEAKVEISNYIEQLNEIFESANNYEPETDQRMDMDTILSTFSVTKAYSYRPIQISPSDYITLASMCVQYTIPLVKQALVFVYNNYINQNNPVRNLGALVRSSIRNHSFFKIAS